LVVHHIAADGWSMGVLLQDLSTAYTARHNGNTPDWAPLPLQYADYATWQHTHLNAADDPGSGYLGEQLAYWTEQLAGLPSTLPLPTDRPRPAVTSHHGAMLPFTIDPTTHGHLLDLARRNNATLFMVCQTAITTLLTRLGAGHDIPLGTPIAGRTNEHLDHLIGFFLNTLVLRTNTEGNPKFTQLLKHVKETNLTAHTHQDLPFDHLVEALNPTRTLAHHPLFQVLLVKEDFGDKPSFDIPDASTSPVRIPLSSVQFDLTFGLSERTGMNGNPAGVDGYIEYAHDLFDESTAERIAERLIRVLRQVAADDGRRVEDFDVLLEGERDWLLDEKAVGDTPAKTAGTVVEAFAAQVAAHPDTTAVIAGENSWTYAELDARTNQLARHLLRQGLAAGGRVAVALRRSPDLIETFLAVAKTGATFVPIDTGHPTGRIQHLLADSDPTLLITTSDFAPPTHSAVRIDIDDPGTVKETAELAKDPLTDVERGGSLTPASGFYLMYTSGSTGTPKGVLTPHSAVTALAADTTWTPFAAGRTLFHAPHTFDASTLEIWIPLLNGGTTVIAPPQAIDTTTLPHLIRKHDLDAVHLTAGLFRVIAEEEPTTLAGLPHLLTGGDTVPTHAITRTREVCSQLTIHHLYGPTETTLCATTHTLTPDNTEDIPNPLPLGRPRDGMRVYVLDHRLQPVPPGVTGELYLAGNGLAHGYLDQPHTTAERFIPDPHTTTPGARMYRTGDLARHTPQGHLQFLGRNDHQIKIRGHRIEPAEIENTLTNHPHIQNATIQPHHP
ncbi:amino acid adenylation domain-containing protein, partial [Streptomyces sp. B6B3]|uniref:non-ribosomal peptide synthetase n=1 Tax=Streptomyces sp. B6B3 TaxID=3153570 RepID=UPI00325C3501